VYTLGECSSTTDNHHQGQGRSSNTTTGTATLPHAQHHSQDCCPPPCHHTDTPQATALRSATTCHLVVVQLVVAGQWQESLVWTPPLPRTTTARFTPEPPPHHSPVPRHRSEFGLIRVPAAVAHQCAVVVQTAELAPRQHIPDVHAAVGGSGVHKALGSSVLRAEVCTDERLQCIAGRSGGR